MHRKKTDTIIVIGRRKEAVARVSLDTQKTDVLRIIVNNKDFKDYFNYFEWQDIILSPLKLAGKNTVDVQIRVSGGGIKAQAGAIRLGIARALIKWQPDLRPTIKRAGFLTRDARIKERKKPGLKRARRAPQWSKR